MLYKTMSEIRKANKDAGRHFFDKGNDEFFGGETFSEVYGGHYFITSRQLNETVPKEYTIWDCHEDGTIHVVTIDEGTDEERTHVRSLIAARAHALRLAKGEEEGSRKPKVYGTLSSDRSTKNAYRDADETIRATLTVERGLDVEVSVTTKGMLWLRIERQEEPGVVLRHFRYDLSTNAWDDEV